MTQLARNEDGAVLVEVTVMLAMMLVIILGSIDFLFAFYQWNAAAKAVAVGARIASVSDPVASGLRNLSMAVLGADRPPGAAMPNFVVVCDGARSTCTCIGGTCSGVGAYDEEAMRTIVYGRGSSSCDDAKSFYYAGMCDVFPRITPANVVISYAQTGLGFADRPAGPVPTITISLQNLPFRFFFLSGLARFRNIPIPALKTSATGEDLSSRAPTF